jgi:hypothetical protein
MRAFVGAPALLILAVVAAVSGGTAACNVVPQSRAGDGSAGVSGYTVSQVRWEPVPGNPALFASVRFQLDGPAGDVACSPDGGLSWFPCSPSGGEWVCPLGGFPVALADSLRIVATN